jgi:hypothetical protein
VIRDDFMLILATSRIILKSLAVSLSYGLVKICLLSVVCRLVRFVILSSRSSIFFLKISCSWLGAFSWEPSWLYSL